MSHQWQSNVIAEERVDVTGKTHPTVHFFPKCARCGCLTNGSLYRPKPGAAWQPAEPECAL